MHIYGLILGICFVVGITFFQKNNKIIPKNKENNFILFLLIFGLIGARTYSVIDDWSYYSQHLGQIINTRGGGLGILGGLIGGLIYIFVFSKKNHLNFIQILNNLAPIIPLCQGIGRWGNFVNTEVFGIPTYTSFGQFIPQNLRPVQFQNFSYFHPVWLYESFLDLILFIFLSKSKKNQLSIYLIGYGLIRFFLEFLRWDTFTINQIKVGQIISLSLIVIGLLLLNQKSLKNT